MKKTCYAFILSLVVVFLFTPFESAAADNTFDAKNVPSPMLFVQLKTKLMKMQIGQTIQVLSKDSKAITYDIPEACKVRGGELIEQTDVKDNSGSILYYDFLIKKVANR